MPAITSFKTIDLNGLNGSNGLDLKPDYKPFKIANFNGSPFKPDRLDHREQVSSCSSYAI